MGLPQNLASLLTPEAYPHPVRQVQLIETHVSWVLLAGELAYKIKRPVRYPFVDMRTPAQRHFFCREELRLNRRFAPDLYLDVVSITSDGRQARIGGAGEVIEHAVRMRQFDTREELDRLIAEQRVEPNELLQFGERLAQVHARFAPSLAQEPYGSLAAVKQSLQENLEQVAGISKRAGLEIDDRALEARMLASLEALGARVESRRASGRVKECHGDLHCRNVVRIGGQLIAFDGLEFEAAFRWIDVAEEIAFLFMDLSRRGAGAHANAFVNGYLAEGGDYEAARLLRLYGAHRALVRAKVAALESGAAGDERARQVSDHAAYVECARSLLERPRPAIILMSGMSGSGKTWLAQRVARSIGAIHVCSDIERKRIAGMAARGSSRSGVEQGIYTREASDATYRRLLRCASDIVGGSFCAIVDATFQRREDRAVFAALAARLGVPLVIVRCRAPSGVLEARILQRQRQGGDASEADLAVLERQRATFEAIDPGEALEVIEADTTREDIVAEVGQALRALDTGRGT